MDRIAAPEPSVRHPEVERDLVFEIFALDKALRKLDIRDIATATSILARMTEDRRILRFWHLQEGRNALYGVI